MILPWALRGSSGSISSARGCLNRAISASAAWARAGQSGSVVSATAITISPQYSDGTDRTETAPVPAVPVRTRSISSG